MAPNDVRTMNGTERTRASNPNATRKEVVVLGPRTMFAVIADIRNFYLILTINLGACDLTAFGVSALNPGDHIQSRNISSVKLTKYSCTIYRELKYGT